MSTRASILSGLGLLCGAAFVDWVTGPDIALSILYLVPISLVATRTSRAVAFLFALACGATWLAVELIDLRSSNGIAIPVWNAVVRTTFFCLVSVLLAEVQERKRAEKSLLESQDLLQQRARKLTESEATLHEQADILQSILNSMGDGVVVADSKGALVLVNPAAQRLLKFPHKGQEVRNWFAFEEACLPFQGKSENPLSRAVRGEAVDGAEMFLQHENLPEGIWLSVTGRPLTNPKGAISGGVIVFSDITARKDLERQISEASEREQRRIGEDLHDGLCQQLVGAAFAARKLAARLADLTMRETDDATRLAELLGESISQARDMARGLYLVELGADGLTSALEELATQTQSRHAVSCRFVDQSADAVLDETSATSLFRIAQEAVNNALKHAQAGQITLTLASDTQRIELRIEDDGAGIPANFETRGGMGLQIMSYRARMIGASLDVGSRPGGGTIVSCSARRMEIPERKTHAQRN